MLRNALRWSSAAVFLFVVIPSLCSEEAAEEQEAPTIREMKALVEEVEAKEAAVAREVRETISRAEHKLRDGLPEVAKEMLLRLERTVEKFTAAEQKALAECHLKIDKALGAEKEKIVEQIEKKLEAEALRKEQEEEAERILLRYKREMLVEKALKKKQADQFAQEAWNLLHIENKPREALEWATTSLQFDPENKKALDVKAGAELELGLPSAETRAIMGIAPRIERLRESQAVQELENAKGKARRLYTEGKFEEAIAEWRKAQTYVETLAPYMPVEQHRKEVLDQIELTRTALQEAEKELAARREREMKEVIEERISDAERREIEREARAVEDVSRLKREKRYEEALKEVKEWRYQEPESVLAPVLEQDIVREEHKDRMGDLVWTRERQTKELIEQSYDKLIPYSAVITYPDTKFWKEKVLRRPPVRDPSREIPLTEEEKAIYEKLQTEMITLDFDDTPLMEVIDFLREVTGVNFTVLQQDLPPDGAPITLHIETTLGLALDEICALSDMAWKVKGPVVKIGNPERLKEYELRVYDIRDLLYNITDQYGGYGGGYGGRGAGGYEGGGVGGYEGYEEFGQWGGEAEWGYAEERYDEGRGGYREDYTEDWRDRAESLRLLIQYTVAPGTWVAGGSIGGETRYGSPTGRPEGGRARYGPGSGLAAQFEAAAGPGASAPSANPGPLAQVPGAGPELFAPEVGVAAPTAAELATQPRGRIFMRGGNPGDLLIIQTPEVHRQIWELLETLRMAEHIQVHVEARFLTVSADFMQEVGFGWDAFAQHREAFEGPGLTQTRYTNIYSPNVASAMPVMLPTGDIVVAAGAATPGVPFIGTGLPFNEPSTGLNLNFSIFDEWSLTGFFRAAQSYAGTEVLSAPNITLMNAQRGYLTINTTWNYISTFDVEEGIPVPETETVDDTISLFVRPVVSADRRYVFLELLPYTSRVLGFDIYPFETAVAAPGVGDGAGAVTTISNFLQLPKTVYQELGTTVCVPDKGVLLIGGLADTTRTTREMGVPVLNKIPLLKRLFTSEGARVERSHLLILVQPEIVLLPEREAEAY